MIPAKNILLFFVLLFVACVEKDEPQVYSNYSGSWKCEETSSLVGYLKPYMVLIDRSSTDSTQYFIRNFFDAGNNQMIVVRMEGSNVSLLQQPTSALVLQSFSGQSSPYTSLTLKYTIYDGERNVYFEATYSRK